ncbi:hypothetical protein NP493_1494g00012 [Ridgeia piscesae]|uniref:V-type proton ATPase subunit n=1 Tax=Ridgeia piscesae TaxID=27915 RepID=A0AAD9NAD5_RIDPI|nr:hypothetical protein NP493_1494g00012 [Ridgeia piscesae]
MGILIPIIVMTLFWGLIGLIGPFIIPKGPNRWVVQVMIVMTCVCCWLFWAITFLAQLNPLFGPMLEKKVVYLMQDVWKP